MSGNPADVRRRRSGAVVVTGAASEIGTRMLSQLDTEGVDAIAFDADVPTGLDGPAAVVHLGEPRAVGAALAAADSGGAQRFVAVTSSMVYGAEPDNNSILSEDSPLRAADDGGVVSDWLAAERMLSEYDGNVPVTVVRPSILLGVTADPGLARSFDAPRLLRLRDGTPRWQFCHVDDLCAALSVVISKGIDGPVTVSCPGWLDHADVERITGLRSVVVPTAVAMATATRLHRTGLLSAPASDLRYLMHPWLVDSQRLRDQGWEPLWDNESALRAQLALIGDRSGVVSRVVRSDVSRAAAGAVVAVAGTLAVRRATRARRGV